MKRFRLLLILTMLLVYIGSNAQTVVEFVAGVDKGQHTEFDRSGHSGHDSVEKGGVTMSCDNATFAADKYSVRNYYGFYGKTLSFKSEKKEIASIEFVDGSNLATFRCSGYDSETGKWTGRTTNVDFSIIWGASFSKVVITLYDRPMTTLSFAQPVVYNYIEQQTNTIPNPTLKCGDNVLIGLPLTYESSNTAVADVIHSNDATAIVPKAEGSAVITAKFAGNDKYDASSEARFTINVVNGKKIFHESFSNISGVGGNDGNFDYTNWNDNLNTNLMDNPGWETHGVEFLGSWAYNAAQCVRVETGASLTTPALANLSGDAFFIFRAAQNRNEETKVNLTISGGGSLEQRSVTLSGREFTDYVVPIKDATPDSKITLNCGLGGSFYLDDVKVERAIILDATADNSKTLQDNSSMAEGATVNVMLKRSLSSKCWNTICIPFSIKREDLASVFGENTVVVAFDGFDAAENTICFKLAENIVAGTPCLIWPSSDITSIMARDVTPTDKVHNIVSNGISFKGVYNPTVISYNDVFLDLESRLDSPDEVEGSNRIGGFNAYFSGLTDVSTAILKIGNASSISGTNTDKQSANRKVYTIDGRLVGDSVSHLAKGIYIVDGKKIVVK